MGTSLTCGVSTNQQVIDVINLKLELIDLVGATGNILTPVFGLDMQNGFVLKSGRGLITYTPVSDMTFLDMYGVLKTDTIADSNGRFESKGLRFDGPSTNELVESDNNSFVTTGNWSTIGATLALSLTQVSTITGTFFASELTEDSSTGFHYISQTIISSDNDSISVQIKAKPNGRDWLAIVLYDRSGVEHFAYFDVANGVTGSVDPSIDAKISKRLSNGSYLCSVTMLDVGVGSTNHVARYYLSSGDGVVSYSGDGSSGMYLEHPQMEKQAVTSSFIPTSTTSVSRSASTLIHEGYHNVPNFSEGATFRMVFNSERYVNGKFMTLYELSTMDTLNSFSISQDINGDILLKLTVNSVVYTITAQYSNMNLVDGQDITLETVFGVNSVELFVDGGAQGNLTLDLTEIPYNFYDNDSYIGKGAVGDDFTGHIRNVKWYAQNMSTTEVSLTS